MRSSFLTSIMTPAMRYLKFSSTEPTELDRVRQQRREISEKLTLTDTDRAVIKGLDETIEMLNAISK